MKKYLSVILIILSILCVSCRKPSHHEAPNTLSDIAYNNSSSEACRVYLLENNTYVPYLVLTDDYYGNCLLLRENCLDAPMEYNPVAILTPSYYEACNIDIFLNTEYKNRLSNYVNTLLIDVDLVITSQSSIGKCGNELKTIERQIFLLSMEELGFADGRIFLAEGRELDYFSDERRCVAYTDNGKTCKWYLRTPDTWDDDVISYIDTDGAYCTSGISTIKGETMNYIRPALCLDKNRPVRKALVNERPFYVVE